MTDASKNDTPENGKPTPIQKRTFKGIVYTREAQNDTLTIQGTQIDAIWIAGITSEPVYEARDPSPTAKSPKIYGTQQHRLVKTQWFHSFESAAAQAHTITKDRIETLRGIVAKYDAEIKKAETFDALGL